MSFEETIRQLVETALEIEELSHSERGRLERAWRDLFPEPFKNWHGQMKTRWVEKDALELYRGENAQEFLVLPLDWKNPAFRCRADSLPEFEYDYVVVAPVNWSWSMLFMGCDLEGGPYFTRREWHEDVPA